MKRLGLLFVLLFLNAGVASADLKSDIQDTVDKYLSTRFLNAVFRFEDGAGNQVASGAKGVYNLSGIQLAAEQKMPIASGTKPITAAAILRLQEKKLLNVHDPIVKYLKDDSKVWENGKVASWGKHVSIHHLLTHTSGIAEYIMAMKIDPSMPHHKINMDILHFACSKPLEFTPGSQYKYTNTNFVILGLIIEKVSGKTLSQFFNEEFFEPLDMKNTHLATLEEAIAIQNTPEKTEYPVRYFLIPTGEKPKFIQAKVDFVLVPYADGGVISTTRDMIKWYRALNTGKVLSTKSFELMTKKYKEIPDKFGRKSYTGYGVVISTLPSGEEVVYHAGSAVAIRSESGFLSSKPNEPGAADLYFSIISNVMVHIPEDMKDKIDTNDPANQLDIIYFREAIFKAFETRD